MTSSAIPISILFLCGFFTTTAPAQDVNLFKDGQPKLVAQSGTEAKNTSALYDNNPSTTIEFKLRSEPIDLVFSFADQTVTIKRLELRTKGLVADTVQVELLASNISKSDGYRSLQSEPLRASAKSPQSIRFPDGAAKWVMIRFAPLKPNASVVVAEIRLSGYVGEPITTYKFDESPTDAIQVLSNLSESVSVVVSADETAMFEDAKDGKFDDISFAEASLLSSNVLDREKRKQYLAAIDILFQQAQQKTPAAASAFEKGQTLLDMLHSTSFRNGYQEHQTDVSVVLDTQRFNCVSSATLYNILARKMGLDARGIEVPDHAFSILYDGTNHVDIETTTKAGFNPAGNRAGLDQFQRQTGFVYIPDRNRANRRELDETGMVAITYYNHGVELTKDKRFNEALICYFKALSLDPKNKSAVKNILVLLANWSGQLAKQGDLEKAIAVATSGLELAPDDWRLKNNHLVVWQKYVIEQVEAGKSDEVLQSLKTATANAKNNDLSKLQSWVFTKTAESMVREGEWNAGIEFAEQGIEQVDEIAAREIIKWKLNAILRWSKMLLDKKDFAAAVDVLSAAASAKHISGKWQIDNNLAHAVNEWATHETKSKGEEAGRELLNNLTKRFPKTRQVQSVSNSFTDKAVKELLDAKDYEGALKLYARAREQNPKDYHLKRNEVAVWVMMGKPFIENRNWEKAIDVYQRAHAARPEEHSLRKNLTYILQEWSRDVGKKDGVAAGENIIAQWAPKFPKIYQIKQIGGSLVTAELKQLIASEEFETAAKLLDENRSAFLDASALENRIKFLYYQHTKKMVENKEWENAIAVYESAFKIHPKSMGIKNNLAHVWNAWAGEFMDKEEWQKAIEIYEQGLESVPYNSTLSNNLRYCKSKLK